MLSSRSLWVHKRISALDGRQGFVAVPAADADTYIANGWASRVFNPWATRAAPDAPFVDVNITVTVTPGTAITAASPVGTTAATVSAAGGEEPYTYTLTNNNSGNFVLSGTNINTAVTGLSVGPHVVAVKATDNDGVASAPKNYTVTVAVADEPEPEADEEEADAIAEFVDVETLPTDAESGTLVARIELYGKDPHTYTWLDNDGGNFRRSGTDVFTNATPLAAGTHTISIRVTDADGVATEIIADVEVTDA